MDKRYSWWIVADSHGGWHVDGPAVWAIDYGFTAGTSAAPTVADAIRGANAALEADDRSALDPTNRQCADLATVSAMVYEFGRQVGDADAQADATAKDYRRGRAERQAEAEASAQQIKDMLYHLDAEAAARDE